MSSSLGVEHLGTCKRAVVYSDNSLLKGGCGRIITVHGRNVETSVVYSTINQNHEELVRRFVSVPGSP